MYLLWKTGKIQSFSGVKHTKMEQIRIRLPEKVQWIIRKLGERGFDAYAVGGCVRDSILGREAGGLGYHNVRKAGRDQGDHSGGQWIPGLSTVL